MSRVLVCFHEKIGDGVWIPVGDGEVTVRSDRSDERMEIGCYKDSAIIAQGYDIAVSVDKHNKCHLQKIVDNKVVIKEIDSFEFGQKLVDFLNTL